MPQAGAKKYDETGRHQPLASDLTALLLNEADYRLGDLKDWLKEVHYRSKRLKGRDAERAATLFDRFFELVRAVTPQANIEFKEVDETGVIQISTNGRVVPLEAVSQGTASVLCWVGLMLQRMHEVHRELSNPEEGPTLVLIDEIDAHMHPAWQRELVPTLRKFFPGLQVIATTHSPMIVGSMAANEIFTARQEGNRVVIKPSEISTRGLRADQVLTSPLFRLGSAHVDPVAAEMQERYIELASRLPDTLSEKEKAELNEAEAYLDKATLSSVDRFQAQQAFDVMEKTIKAQLNELKDTTPDQLRKVEAEIKVQLAEAAARERQGA
jgi:hypothetical protein